MDIKQGALLGYTFFRGRLHGSSAGDEDQLLGTDCGEYRVAGAIYTTTAVSCQTNSRSSRIGCPDGAVLPLPFRLFQLPQYGLAG